MANKLTFKQRLHNALGSQQCENIKSTHSYLHGMMYSAEEWDGIWNRSKDATWAHSFGRMVGFDQVWWDSVCLVDPGAYKQFLKALETDPEVARKDPRAMGKNACHALSSGVVEVAADGKSCRSTYITPGPFVMGGENSLVPSGRILNERYGSDFVYNNGRWEYLHEQVCPDGFMDYNNGNWAHDRYEQALKGNYTQPGYHNPPPVTDPGPLHVDYDVVQGPQKTVYWPEPYETLDDEHSFSPGRNDPNNF